MYITKSMYFRAVPIPRNVYVVSIDGETIAEFVDIPEIDASEQADILVRTLDALQLTVTG